ncbi:MAG: hypothetical protein FWG45_05940 [Oscillospiraceae bacterium]|nr:hypothetical protein [Oscillospiraceae bacterium]
MGIAAIILGALAIVNSWYGGGVVFGAVGLILAIMGKKKAEETGEDPKKEKIGLILSIIGLGLSLIMGTACLLSCLVCNQAGGEACDAFNEGFAEGAGW